jgi:tRNA dimethylallyltransferase
MDIGTAKPTVAVRSRVPHHLIDIRDPAANYSAGEFVRDAAAAMHGIWAAGRQPLLVGGTMLYFHALTEGIAPLPEADPQMRARIDAEASQRGWEAVHRELARVDPAAAARIHAHDPQRIQRALEVFRLTGETITSLQHKRRPLLGGVRLIECVLAPVRRSDLHERIERRLCGMLADGLLDEVRGLYRRGDLTAEHSSMRAVGYRQLWRHLSGGCTLEEASNAAIVATRQLAKRQFTWLRRRAGACWFDSMHPDVADRVFDALMRGEFAEWSPK